MRNVGGRRHGVNRASERNTHPITYVRDKNRLSFLRVRAVPATAPKLPALAGRGALMPRSVALLAFALLFPHRSLAPRAPDTVRVEGGQVVGTITDGLRVFKGIPYAAAPVGALRWKPPQPVAAWSGAKSADAFSPECVQPPYPAGSAYFMPPEPMSEDCLYLNVWSAAAAGAKRPVMVWIHGGAWTRGAGSVGIYDGANLAKKGVVVVSLNYRLGSLGFLAHPELTAESPAHASGNYGMLDQVAALRWVQRHIAAFGGDASRVTIFGESAGSWSVNVLQASPLAAGLFHRAIGESGGRFAHNPTLAEAEQGGVALAASLGATSLAALRALPAEQLANARAFNTDVTVDGLLLTDQVARTFATKQHRIVPVLVGSNADEFTTLTSPALFPKTMDGYRKMAELRFPGMLAEFDAAYPVKTDADIAGAILGAGRDQSFTLEMRTWARFGSAAGAPAFLYQWTHVPPIPNPKWGAYHGSEIIYAFNNVRQRSDAPALDLRLSDQLSSYWVNFATSGNPNGPGLPHWPAYDRESEPYLELGDSVRVGQHLLKAQLDFLERVAERRRVP